MGMCEQVRTAVILAAGNGVRLTTSSGLPKPLVPIAGKPLLGHVLSRLELSGIQEVFVVVGYRGQEIRSQFGNNWGDVSIQWLENPHFELGNGRSLLAAAGQVVSDFLLLMADHIFESDTLEKLLQQPLPTEGGVLAVDDEPSRVFDLPDATKVQRQSGRVMAIGKELPEYDAVDTGMFLLTPAIFRAMRNGTRTGPHSLSQGVGRFTRENRVDAWSIEGRHWIDVDTPEALEEARRLCSTSVF